MKKSDCNNVFKVILNIEIPEFLFYVAFAFYSFAIGIVYINYNIRYTSLIKNLVYFFQIIAFFCLMLKIIIQKKRLATLPILILLCLIGLLSWFKSGENYFFWLVIFIACGYAVKLRKIAIISLYTTLTIIVFSFISLNLGTAYDASFIGQNGQLRQSLGFIHPNTFARYILMLCIPFSILYYKSKTLVVYFMLVFSGLICYRISGSRTSLILVAVQLFLVFLYSTITNHKIRKKILAILTFACISCIIMSYYFMLSFDDSNPVHHVLNQFFSERLSLAHLYYKHDAVTLFGHEYVSDLSANMPASYLVDNSYCHLVLREGIIPTTFLLIMIIYLLIKINKNLLWNAFSLGFFIILLFSFTETVGIMVETNYFLLILASFLFQKNKQETTK